VVAHDSVRELQRYVDAQAGGPGNDKADLRPDSPQFQAAMEACKSKMPAGGGFATSGSGK